MNKSFQFKLPRNVGTDFRNLRKRKFPRCEGIAFAHRYGKKVYVTANITAHNRDLAGVEEYFRELRADGFFS